MLFLYVWAVQLTPDSVGSVSIFGQTSPVFPRSAREVYASIGKLDNSMRTAIQQSLKKTNSWILVGLAVASSIVISDCLTAVLSLIIWGRVPIEVLLISTLDAAVVPSIVAPIVIYLVKRAARLEDINVHLQAEISDRKRIEEEINRRAENLMAVSDLAIECAAASPNDDLFELIAKKLASITGALAVTISTYDVTDEALTLRHCIFPGSNLDLVNKLLGRSVVGLKIPVSPDMHDLMLAEIINISEDLTSISFGTIAPPLAGIIQRTFGVGLFMALVLTHGDELRGTAMLAMHAGQPPPDTDLAKALAHVAAVSLRRKRAEDQVRYQAETLTALHETALDLAAQRSLPELLQAILARAVGLLKANAGCIYLYRPAGDDLELVCIYNLDPGFRDTVLRRGEGLSGRVLESGRSMAVADYSQWEGKVGPFIDAGLAAIVAVPVFWSGRLLGVINVLDDSPRAFSAGDIALLERFTPLAAAALENSRLVHDLQQQMEQLKSAQAQLVQTAKLAAVGELAAGVAHELNNPLAGILAYAELLLRDQPSDAPARHDLAIIVKQTLRARDIVRNLMDYARQTKPQRQPADVNQVLCQTLDLVRQLLEGRGVAIEEDYALDLGLLTVDSGQMKQVFLNLITNAFQAMPQGGTLSLRTARVGNEVTVSVSDTGQGVPPELRERIFEPFFTTKPVGEGTGLGLSISLGIVKEHGGRITVESRLATEPIPSGQEDGPEGGPEGSVFTVWLPADPGHD
jgi:signal transduction histidine kinase